jgi:hypothetical protein
VHPIEDSPDDRIPPGFPQQFVEFSGVSDEGFVRGAGRRDELFGDGRVGDGVGIASEAQHRQPEVFRVSHGPRLDRERFHVPAWRGAVNQEGIAIRIGLHGRVGRHHFRG